PPNPNIFSPQSLTSNPPSPVVHIHEKEGSKKGQAMYLSIENLANCFTNPKIKNNLAIITKRKSSNKQQKKTKVSQLIEEDSEAGPGLITQAYRKGQRDDSEEDLKNLDKKILWLVQFPDNKEHQEVWQKGIQTAKDMFKVDEVAKKAKEIYLQWGLSNEKVISEKIESLIQEYKAEDKKVLIRVKFAKDDSSYSKRHNYIFKIIDKYQPIRESKRAGKKFVLEVEDVAELEKILKRPIKLLDITYETIFNKSLKIVELAEQVFGANHAGGKLANEIIDWHPTSARKNTKPSKVVTKESELLKDDKIQEIQPGQWCDKGKKIHGPDSNVVYWPKNRHWESIKNITESTAPSIPSLGGMEVLTDYRAKCPRLQELKKKMRWQNNRMQSDLFCEALPVTEKWEYLGAEWKPSDLKNDIIHLPLNTLPDKFLKDMLTDKKVIYWELGYAMTIHTSQGMTLKAPQSVWVIDENLAWDNLIYLAVGRVEYLSQLIRVETPPLPPEIAQEIEEAKKNRRLEHELRPSIQEKLIGYMGQDKEKGREFDLTVDYILTLKRIQEDRCVLCLIEMKFEWDRPGDISVDRIHNNTLNWLDQKFPPTSPALEPEKGKDSPAPVQDNQLLNEIFEAYKRNIRNTPHYQFAHMEPSDPLNRLYEILVKLDVPLYLKLQILT
ncbi:1150_t:CDS:10, partial [Racocetra fulgida]